MSTITATRDAVVTALNAASFFTSFTPSITAVAIYDIYFNLQQLTSPRVVVVPSKRLDEIITRASDQKIEVGIDVAVQIKYDAPTTTILDPYMGLAESICDFFKAKILTGATLGNGAVCLSVTWPHGPYLDKHMQDFRVFTSIVSLSFTVIK